jgi:putative membrane protein insertion efficiency factor
LKLKAGSFILVCLLSALAAFSDDKDSLRFILKFNPVPGRAGAPRVAPESFLNQTSELKMAGAALVRFYQVFISPQDIPACPFDPTCSEYGKQAVMKYGLLAGIILAADRYQRCNGLSSRFYPRDPASGRLIDPP